jgi:hypothetical protein
MEITRPSFSLHSHWIHLRSKSHFDWSSSCLSLASPKTWDSSEFSVAVLVSLSTYFSVVLALSWPFFSPSTS